ncbi:hypothetical protein C8Q77DRAFT_1141225 [Trametes polyzona]|nr:hypothetical protein C8Q77DRAFT_1141225 [Trametes polyzona]
MSLQEVERTGMVDISSCEPCRYRLIDCTALVKDGHLVIYDYEHFPAVPYAAVSYVWRGNGPSPDFPGPVFSVRGAEEADPIGINVLREACVASLAREAAFLWLDRLSIMQTCKIDKKWQIREMYMMYKSCHVCIVVPGGLQRLVRLDEETQWIHRGWTLQEAVAPPDVAVLFSWKLGDRAARAGDTQGRLQEVTPSTSALAPLALIVDASTTGSLSITHGEKTLPVEVKLFSPHSTDASYRDFPFWRPTRQVMSANVGALARIMSPELDEDMKEYSIWQSALMRTSSRPVDMVFSIMGLFGVTLDTKAFGENDRVEATIALAQSILQKGGRANWLAAAFKISPSPQVSTFPVFPRTEVSGKAYVRIGDALTEVSSLMENEYPIAAALVPAPQGTMDTQGYLHFVAKAIRLAPTTTDSSTSSSDPTRPTQVTAVDGSCWRVSDIRESNLDDACGAFAVLVGFFVGYYPGGTPSHDANNVRAMVVEQHRPNRFHVRTYLALSMKTRGWAAGWPERSFSVGGPDVGAPGDDLRRLPVQQVSRERFRNNPRSGPPDITLEDVTFRQARWAVPQKTLERDYGSK